MVSKSYRLFLVLLYCTLIYNNLLAQSSFSVLNVGDRMPDIPLGAVVNNITGKTKFSDFKGKLIILDFWNTHCGSCIEAMPHMEELQKKFKGRIQIFLVNPLENADKINKRFAKIGRRMPTSLPSIVAASDLDKLFPTPFGHPHHVWIDGDGIIRIRGSQLVTYEDKINAFLSGQDFFSMKDNNSSRKFDKTVAYNTMLNEKNAPPVLAGSFITGYNNEYAALTGGKVEGFIDSTSGVYRNTYINTELLQLYFNVFKKELEENNRRVKYCSDFYYGLFIPYCILNVTDSLQYTCEYIFRQRRTPTDQEFIKSRYCYEQITSVSISDSARKELMLNDLNNFLFNSFKTKSYIENKKIPSYILVRSSIADKLRTNENTDNGKTEQYVKNSKQMMRFKNRDVWSALSDYVIKLFKNERGNSTFPIFLFDETGIEFKIDLELPHIADINTIDDLRKSLNAYGLDIIKQDRFLNMLIISH